MENFKLGDKVYCPVICGTPSAISTAIHTLVATDDAERPLGVRINDHHILNLLPDGSFTNGVKIRLIHHATMANKCLLDKLYGVVFETPEGSKQLNDCFGYIPRGSD